MGHFRYLLFYLICGYIATFAHIFMDPLSTTPLVGASGAIAGVLGAYLILFPRANVLTLAFVIFFIQVIHIPAVIFLGLWFLLQLLNVTGFSGQGAESVAFWAHIGGFIAGVVLVKFFTRSRTTYY